MLDAPTFSSCLRPGPGAERRRSRRVVISANTLLALSGCAILGLAGCAKSTSEVAAAVAPVVVELTPVSYSVAALPIRATGVLSRKTEAELAFKVGGVVEAVFVRAGDVVQSGQVLARLRLDEIDAQVMHVRSAHEKAQRDLARSEQLRASDAISAEGLQDARTALEQVSAQLRIAEFNQRFAVITAPAAGRVLRRFGEPNELVAAGKSILSFAADADGWLVRAGLAERDVARIRLADRAEVTACGVGKPAWTGRVTQISEAVELATRTTQIEIAIEASSCAGRSGAVVAVSVQPQAVEARPVVPASALIEGVGGEASLFVVEAGSLVCRRVAVEIEALIGTQVYLRTALPTSAQVVAVGSEFLRDGMAIVAKK